MTASKLAVVDDAGGHLFWVDDQRAQEMLKAGQVRLIRRRNFRILQARAGVSVTPQLALDGNGTGFHAMKTVHRRETEDNPPRVWCLLHSWRILAIAGQGAR